MGFRLRAAAAPDVEAIVGLIAALAAYERLTHLLDATPEKLAAQLFGPHPVAEALVAERDDGAVIGFALYFSHFSTFLCKPGLWLEDLFVAPEHRGLGIGTAMLVRLAALAVERGCGRFEWAVLDWNAPSIRFYQAMGASVLPDWRICRVSGAPLPAMAQGAWNPPER